jgi:hypothetical protein
MSRPARALQSTAIGCGGFSAGNLRLLPRQQRNISAPDNFVSTTTMIKRDQEPIDSWHGRWLELSYDEAVSPTRLEDYASGTQLRTPFGAFCAGSRINNGMELMYRVQDNFLTWAASSKLSELSDYQVVCAPVRVGRVEVSRSTFCRAERVGRVSVAVTGGRCFNLRTWRN